MAATMPKGFRFPAHQHRWPQLVYASEGALSVTTSLTTWIVPPSRAVWVPSDLRHEVGAIGPTKMRTLYVQPDLASHAHGATCQVLDISPLFREMILHILAIGYLEKHQPAHARLAGVLLDLIKDSQQLPLSIPMLQDPCARRIAKRLLRGRDLGLSLDQIASASGVSLRTLERRFRSETGWSLGRWRQQARLLQALQLLAKGTSVSKVAREVGYESPSAFVSMFRKSLGSTPRRYLNPFSSD